MIRKFFVLSLLVVFLASFAPIVSATHSWGNYHWGRTANPFTLKLGDNVSNAWDSFLGTTSSDLGDALNQADTLQFSAQAPNVANDQMYVMYVLAQGQTANNFSIGPLAEIVLQVDAS